MGCRFSRQKNDFIIEVDNYDDLEPYKNDYVIQEVFDFN